MKREKEDKWWWCVHIGTALDNLRKRERIKKMIWLYEWCSMSEHATSVQIRAFIKFLAVLKRRALINRFNSEQPILSIVGLCLCFIFFLCVIHTQIYNIQTDSWWIIIQIFIRVSFINFSFTWFSRFFTWFFRFLNLTIRNKIAWLSSVIVFSP